MTEPIPLAKLPTAPVADTMALFLDVDGTLLEFSDSPESVDVPAHLIETLGAAHKRLSGALALVTGRPLRDLDRLFAPLLLPGAGIHGIELRGADNGLAVDNAHDAAIRDEKAGLLRTFKDVPGILIEDKGACIAIHYRKAPALATTVDEAVSAARTRLGQAFEKLDGYMVRELRPAGIHKGHAVRQLMKATPFEGRVPVFVGDDVTDEDGFDAVNDLGGVSVLVGSRRPTRARTTLADVTSVRRWLQNISKPTIAARKPQNGEPLQI